MGIRATTRKKQLNFFTHYDKLVAERSAQISFPNRLRPSKCKYLTVQATPPISYLNTCPTWLLLVKLCSSRVVYGFFQSSLINSCVILACIRYPEAVLQS